LKEKTRQLHFAGNGGRICWLQCSVDYSEFGKRFWL